MRTLLLAFTLLGAMPAAAGTLLVLESDGVATLKVGQIIDSKSSISVPAGARLVLMDERGQAATLKGPYGGIPGGSDRAEGPTFLQRLSAVLTAPSTTQADTVLGATRTVAPKSVPPSAWAVDVSAGGTACVRTQADLVLWRPAPRAARIVNMTSGGKNVSFTWPANEATAKWPEGLALADGATFEVSMGSSEKPQAFKIMTAKQPLENDASTLSWLSGADCTAQARVLLGQVGARRTVEGTATKGPVFE